MSADSAWKSVVEGYEYASGQKLFTLTPSANDANVLVVTTTTTMTEVMAEILQPTYQKTALARAQMRQ